MTLADVTADVGLAGSDPVLVATEVGFAYPGAGGEILHHVDLAIQGGQVTAATGASGSGKSTLLHCLAGLRSVTRGEVRALGEVISDMREPRLTDFRRTRFGFVFQAPGLLAEMSGVENVAVAGWMAGQRHRTAWKRAGRLMDELGIGDLVARLPGEMSGGQAQRVAVARALMNCPDIVFADEPTGSLDSASGAAVMEMLHGVTSNGAAVVLVTHDQGLAGEADHRIELHDGHITSAR